MKAPDREHCNAIKHILRYLKGTIGYAADSRRKVN
jgi:hypothetical protein